MEQIAAHRLRVQQALGRHPGQILSHMTRESASPSPYAGLRTLKQITIQGDLAWAEAGVTMDALLRATLRVGRVPLVLPEFKEITVGGAVMGAGLESSSFRHGQFNDTCDRLELLLADGTPITTSPAENADLFYGVSGSYGSLAQLTMAAIRLQPAHPYVEVGYHLFEDWEEGIQALPGLWSEFPSYLDGVILPNKKLLWMPAWVRSAAKRRPTPLSRPWSRWFIQHLIHCGGKRKSDFFTLYDYLFRYDRAAFWMGQFSTRGRPLLKYLFKLGLDEPQLSHHLREAFARGASLDPSWLFRLLFNWRLSSTELYKVLHRLPGSTFASTFLVQDFYLPLENVKKFIGEVLDRTQILPLWLCPISGKQTPQVLSPHHGRERLCNIGVYGMPPQGMDVPLLTQELEQLCADLGGRKMLYSQNCYTPELFWSIYPRSEYENLKHKYRGESLRDFYDLGT